MMHSENCNMTGHLNTTTSASFNIIASAFHSRQNNPSFSPLASFHAPGHHWSNIKGTLWNFRPSSSSKTKLHAFFGRRLLRLCFGSAWLCGWIF